MITILYYNDPAESLSLIHHSIFLVGPTPRSKNTRSWRPEAIKILVNRKYQGTVIVPEWNPDILRPEKYDTVVYKDIVEWEHYGLEHCNRIAAWVPRNMVFMPALTTNVEFGMYVRSARMRYGRPPTAEHCRYLDWVYKKYNPYPVFDNLTDLLVEAMKQ